MADATGQELTARLEVLAADRLSLRVADANAVYPVHIDPTFSDTDWVSLNPGIPGANGVVWAMALDGNDNVYVGGTFSIIGTVAANNIAKWDGSAWSALGSGMNYDVSALATSGTNLYAGGDFGTAGGVRTGGIAKWNGSAWSPLGEGPDGSVRALAMSGTDLCVGGWFNAAGGMTAYNIAKWDGTAWSALGSGMDDPWWGPSVNALAVSGTDLYAGGYFSTAGGLPANYIAKWNGSSWSALGSGMDGRVRALVADGAGHLFVGGDFYFAGTTLSPFIAQANVGPGVAGGQFGGLVYLPGSGFSCTLSDATLGQPYRIQTSPSLAAGSWTNLTNFTYTGPIALTDTSAVTAPKRFYRAVTP